MVKNDLTKKYEYAWERYSKDDLNKVFSLGEKYKNFMSRCKTERECVSYFIEEAEKAGYKNIETLIKENVKLKPGDKVYANNMNKTLALFVIGTEPLKKDLKY